LVNCYFQLYPLNPINPIRMSNQYYRFDAANFDFFKLETIY